MNPVWLVTMLASVSRSLRSLLVASCQIPPPCTPIYQPDQFHTATGAGRAFTGKSAACAALASAAADTVANRYLFIPALLIFCNAQRTGLRFAPARVLRGYQRTVKMMLQKCNTSTAFGEDRRQRDW